MPDDTTSRRASEKSEKSEKNSRTDLTGRYIGLLVALPCWVVLGLALSLTPHAEGHGTHRDLGLPPCQWIITYGIPCPTCGMTTSVSAWAHGNAFLGLKAQPFGVVIFAIVLAGALAGTAQMLMGRKLIDLIRFRWWWLIVIVGGILAGWGIKLAIGYARGIYPLH